MDITIEELDEELQDTLNKIDKIAMDVADGKLDSFEGFMQTEKYNERISEIKEKLQEMGVDLSSLTDEYLG